MGSAQTADESFALLDDFAARGGTFLDTAHVYADWIPPEDVRFLEGS